MRFVRTVCVVAALAGPAVVPSPGRAQSQDVGDKVYQQALKSTVWIVIPERVAAGRVYYRMGTGSLIDVAKKLVLTNYHVVSNKDTVTVQFPIFEKGRDPKKPELVVERQRYLKTLKETGVVGKVLFTDSARDLAVVQLEALPPGVQALRLAKSSVAPGQRIHSIGNPGVSDALWVYTPGNVRSVYHKTMMTAGRDGEEGFKVDCRVVETSSPVNAGDSGGPVLSDKGELVAVTQGHAADAQARSVSYFIDIQEVHDLLAAKKIKLSLPSVAPVEVAARPTGVTIEAPTATDDKAEKEAETRLDLAKDLAKDGKTERASDRLRELIKKYPMTKAAEEARQLLEKLGK